MSGGEGLELYPSQGRADVLPHLQLVVRERPRADVALYAVLEPPVQVFTDREVLGIVDRPTSRSESPLASFFATSVLVLP